MTTYFVDPKDGCDEKGDGLSLETAFATYQHAEDVSWIKNCGMTKSEFLKSITGDTETLMKRFFDVEVEL